ncbi:MAG: hypothetical protein HN849_31235 [Victivallales bacterium]|nr:hypothetical protein [Victivallales bacterium]
MVKNRLFGRFLALATLVLVVSVRGELSVPRLTGRVVDQAGILSQAQKSGLEARIQGLEHASGGQMAVLIIPSLKNDALELFSMRVAETWKIGRKGKDNGALLLVSHQDRKIRLEVGYGWEGKINDAKAGDIIRGMGPFFKKGQFAQGIDFAIADVQQFVTGTRPQGAPAQRRSSGRRRGGSNLFFFILIFAFVSFMGGWRRRRFGFGTMIFMGMGGHSRGGGSSFGGGGGFSGGGGGFGGGGASGGW